VSGFGKFFRKNDFLGNFSQSLIVDATYYILFNEKNKDTV